MQQTKRLAWMFLMMCGLSMAASASGLAALPELLPEATVANPLGFTSLSKTSVFTVGAVGIVSKKSKGTSTAFSPKLGAGRMVFEETESGVVGTCTSTGQAAGTVAVTGTFHVRDANETVGAVLTLIVAIAFLLTPVTITCQPTNIQIALSGCVAGLVLPPYSRKTKELIVDFEKTFIRNDEKIIRILNEANTAEENCEMKASVEGGAMELMSLETTQTLTGFSKGGVAVEVEVMPL